MMIRREQGLDQTNDEDNCSAIEGTDHPNDFFDIIEGDLNSNRDQRQHILLHPYSEMINRVRIVQFGYQGKRDILSLRSTGHLPFSKSLLSNRVTVPIKSREEIVKEIE